MSVNAATRPVRARVTRVKGPAWWQRLGRHTWLYRTVLGTLVVLGICAPIGALGQAHSASQSVVLPLAHTRPAHVAVTIKPCTMQDASGWQDGPVCRGDGFTAHRSGNVVFAVYDDGSINQWTIGG